MGRETELKSALAACTRGLLPQEQFLLAAASWFRELEIALEIPGHAPRSLDEILRDAGFPPIAAPDIDLHADFVLSIRDALLELNPPSDVCQWLFAFSDTPPTRRSFQPLPRDTRYRLGREIARGALGRVVEAVDGDLEREVAIKLVLSGADTNAVERFVREARVAARLDHPNIVPVHDFGEMPGAGGKRQLFLCMKRVKGQDLQAVLRGMSKDDRSEGGRFSRMRLLGIFQDVCLGIAFAHSKGVLHRDLKPSNIMIGDYGETLIVDWGLAKVLGEADIAAAGSSSPDAPAESAPDSTQLTLLGDVLGTPSYMSPEQAAGRIDELDARSDVYALGAVLYAILTWRTPVSTGARGSDPSIFPPGPIQSPSSLVASLHGTSVPEPVPPELDAIVARAMSNNRDKRYPGALELHQDLQLFLEGVRERERGRVEAGEHVRLGRARLARFRELRGLIQQEEREIGRLREAIPGHRPLAEKKPLWDAEARLAALREERIRCIAETGAELHAALAADPGCAEAERAQCDLLFDRVLEAESREDRGDELLQRSLLAEYDRSGQYRKRLEAPGRLTIRTFEFTCDCLAPVRTEGWSAEMDPEHLTGWRAGGPASPAGEGALETRVPRLVIRPGSVRFGHTSRCPRREAEGLEVVAAPYEERARRLWPGASRSLGRTPIVDLELPQGSWCCTVLRPGMPGQVVPVRIDRAGSWNQDVNLHKPESIPDGFLPVPGGPFLFGGLRAYSAFTATERTTRDLFVAPLPVTFAEYIEFLTDLVASGRADEARSRLPREGDQRFLEEGPGVTFRIPAPGSSKFELSAACPIVGVNWFDAIAYAAWRSRREGRVYRLLHEEEYEKSARGVDGRAWSYGNHYDGNFSHTLVSLAERSRPLPVGSFPIDESPYGLRDLSGGALTWCLNRMARGTGVFCSARGGSWMGGETQSAAGYQQGLSPHSPSLLMGFRLAMDPWSWDESL